MAMGARELERVIPAIDLVNGQCVRLTRGDYRQPTFYDGSPLEIALRYEAVGLRRLHLVNLDGARDGCLSRLDILEEIAARTSLRVDYSGGIRDDDDPRRVLDAGATWACVGSVACLDTERAAAWLERYGERLLVSADTLDGAIRARGWLEATALTVFDLVEAHAGRLHHLTCTDISRDGTLAGPNFALYRRLRERFPALRVVASGGVRHLADVRQLLDDGAAGVIVGKALLEGRISLEELVADDLNPRPC
ncbi:MAG: 1-(5-phosphoribosyl)-5-[(5-phosphoribosylamino)methylideneamino] imidazole-4-carboxamide isomerase [Odoribacteraceae bacterium]|jgi:phosphoribosylformimino-5-aminoimidazole carboxamide ribotide isomerase|nr:1-(5-phosphoribosyl)-5-[(5-phosphoribosylamino)methylideneamino] imidazole-4-carboxamide isomerase [Odoribacteraceae bacterium]